MPTATILIADGDWSYIEKFGDDELYVYTSGSTTWFILTSARMGFTFPLTSVPSGAVIQSVSFRFSVQSDFSAPGAEVKIYNGTYAGSYPDVEDWDSFDTELATVDTFTVATHTIPLSPLPTTSGGAVKLMLVPTTSETFFSIYVRPGNDNLKAALIVEYEEPEPEAFITGALDDITASFTGFTAVTGSMGIASDDCTADLRDAVGSGVTVADTFTNAWAGRISTGGEQVAGIGGGRVELYGGVRPLTSAGFNGDPLVVFTLPSTSSANVSGNEVTITGIPPATVIKAGTPTWGRIFDGDGLILADIDVAGPGELGPLGGITLPTTSVAVGQKLRLNSFVYRVG